MRHLLSIFSLVVLLLAGCGNEAKERASKSPSETQPGASSSAPTPGTVQEVPPSPVPDLTLTTLDSTALDLRAQTGRVLLVNFWATWCAPCREEIPDLKALQKEFRDEGLRIIGVALDRKGRAVVAPFAEKLDIPLAGRRRPRRGSGGSVRASCRTADDRPRRPRWADYPSGRRPLPRRRNATGPGAVARQPRCSRGPHVRPAT